MVERVDTSILKVDAVRCVGSNPTSTTMRVVQRIKRTFFMGINPSLCRS